MLRIGSVRLPLLATIGTTGTLRCPHGLPGACAAPRALWLLVLAVIAAGSQPIAADTTTFVPATFGKYESKFVRSIRFPKGDTPVDIRLLCDATLHNDGRGRGLFCEGRDDHPEFHKAVTRHKARALNHRHMELSPTAAATSMPRRRAAASRAPRRRADA